MTNKKEKTTQKQIEIPEPDDRETHDLLIEPSTEEIAEAQTDNFQEDLAREQRFKTNNSDGHTYNPHEAMEQGLTYTPPSDPSVQPSEDDPQGAKVAAGFAPSMEATDPDARRLPDHVEEGDLELRNDIYKTLHYNSETLNTEEVSVLVDQGEVRLKGMVPTQEDIARIYSVVSDIDGVTAIHNNLQIAS